jgi:hypothetical protein
MVRGGFDTPAGDCSDMPTLDLGNAEDRHQSEDWGKHSRWARRQHYEEPRITFVALPILSPTHMAQMGRQARRTAQGSLHWLDAAQV